MLLAKKLLISMLIDSENPAEKAGLYFSVCYEDQTIKHMVNNNHFDASQAIIHGWMAMGYMEDEWFTNNRYLKLGNIFSILNNVPLLLSRITELLRLLRGRFPLIRTSF